jgi:twitching motility protein PilT
VVLIGELRDLETVESALRVAETGHLTFATLHTNSAASTITRIIDIFPANQQSQIRTQLGQVLEGVLCQQLLPLAQGKGRVMALEILLPTPAIRNLIREDKIHQLYSSMTTGQGGQAGQVGQGVQPGHGMQTLNQSLAALVKAGRISKRSAIQCSSEPNELRELLEFGDASVHHIHVPATSLTSRLSL